MHQHHHHRYTGSAAPFALPAYAHHPHVPPGCCRSCGQPSGQCGCGCRVCRKESKELLVEPGAAQDAAGQTSYPTLGETMINYKAKHLHGAAPAQPAAPALPAALGSGIAFIGGGCCVHISVEYAQAVPTAASAVMVIVADSEGTILAWEKSENAGTHYQVKEGIITTKPGATIVVIVNNMVARVRWCEVFSC